MTLYHFGNCLAISYVPYYLTYKYTGLSEYGAFWKCISTVIVYALTQLSKMLILATFFPVPIHEEVLDDGILRQSTFGLEFLKSSVDMIDLVGIYFALARIPGRGHNKILATAVGWGAAELLFTRFLVLWVGAKGIEFNWKYIQMSLDSNVALIQHIATTALVWLWTRHDLRRNFVPLVSALLVLAVFKTLLVDSFSVHFTLDPWTTLILKGVITAGMGLTTIRIYTSVA